MLDELKKTDLSRGGNDRKYILVFRSHLFILDADSDLIPVKDALEDHPCIAYAKWATDLYDFLRRAAESSPDILVGEWYPDQNKLDVWNPKEIIPQTSLQVKKAVNQLGVKTITYGYYDTVKNDFKGKKELPVKKIKGEIPQIMFHGTSTAELEGILRYGLDPARGPSRFAYLGISHSEHIFIAATFEAALYYADHAVEQGKNKRDNFPIILELKIPDPNLLVPDFDADVSTTSKPYYRRPKPPMEKAVMKAMGVSRETGKWGYRGRIPASFIKWVYYYNTYQKKWHKGRPETFEKLLTNYDWETISWKLGMTGYKDNLSKHPNIYYNPT